MLLTWEEQVMVTAFVRLWIDFIECSRFPQKRKDIIDSFDENEDFYDQWQQNDGALSSMSKEEKVLLSNQMILIDYAFCTSIWIATELAAYRAMAQYGQSVKIDPTTFKFNELNTLWEVYTERFFGESSSDRSKYCSIVAEDCVQIVNFNDFMIYFSGLFNRNKGSLVIAYIFAEFGKYINELEDNAYVNDYIYNPRLTDEDVLKIFNEKFSQYDFLLEKNKIMIVAMAMVEDKKDKGGL